MDSLKTTTFLPTEKKMPTTHFESRKGSVQDNEEYCSKGGKFETFGEPQYQGKRNDIQIVKDMVKEGAMMEDIFDALESPNYQTLKTAELLGKYISPKRDCKPTVIWCYGPTEVGKTRWSVNELRMKFGDRFFCI